MLRLFLLLSMGGILGAQPGKSVSAENSAVYLPLVLQGYQPPSNSPFWIEIAALHEIRPTGMAASNTMSETEWRSYLAEVFPNLVNALKESGAGGTRIFISWKDIEPVAPNPDPNYDPYWLSWYDARLNEIGGTELGIIGTVSNAASWASATSPCPPIDADHLDEYARFLTDLVNRYKVAPYHIKYWELENEPDNTT